jgi:hypothetical protein
VGWLGEAAPPPLAGTVDLTSSVGGTVASSAGGGVVFSIGAVNSAVTERASLIVAIQLPVPEQAPPQPANVDPAAGGAVRVTAIPAA